MAEARMAGKGQKGGKITITLDPELHRTIKMAALEEGSSMRDYILEAVLQRMSKDGDNQERKAS